MKSPVNGKEMSLKNEKRMIDYKKEIFEVSFQYYCCEESGEQFTTTELDDKNLIQLYNLYKNKHNTDTD